MDYLAYSLILGQAHVVMLHQVQGHIRLDRTWTTTLDRSVLRPLCIIWPSFGYFTTVIYVSKF